MDEREAEKRWLERYDRQKKRLEPVTSKLADACKEDWGGIFWSDSFSMEQKARSPDWMLSFKCFYPDEWLTRSQFDPFTRERRPPRYNAPPPFRQAEAEAKVRSIIGKHEALVDRIDINESKGIGIWIRPKRKNSIPFPKVRHVVDKAVSALKELRSSCAFNYVVGRTFHVDCSHSKDDGYIFEARSGEEDDDFPNFIGREIVKEAVQKSVPSVRRVDAYDHEKGFYTVQFTLKKS